MRLFQESKMRKHVPPVRAGFAAAVRYWRKQRGYSQEDLAERADLHRTYISDVERGARNVSLESISRLARALKLPVATLFSEPVAPEAGAPKPTDEIAEILLVEHDDQDADSTLKAFRRTHFANRIERARNGQQAINHLFGEAAGAPSRRQRLPQLILLELEVPGVPGLEILQRVKKTPQTADIPIVILTRSEDERALDYARRLGANAVIRKPLQFRGLPEVTSAVRLGWALVKPGVSAGKAPDHPHDP
jgi:two-component system response regulator